MANEQIKSALRASNVKQWQLADAMGMSEDKFCRKMRYELPDDQQRKALVIIHEIAAKKKEAV